MIDTADLPILGWPALPSLYRRREATGQRHFGWLESEHPRDDDGRFAEKAGGGGRARKIVTSDEMLSMVKEAVSNDRFVFDEALEEIADEHDWAREELERRRELRDDWHAHGVHGKAFKQWFGDWEDDPQHASKVIDKETGEPDETYHVPEPKRMYHGSNATFEAFDPSRAAANSLYGPGFYFTDDAQVAESYVEKSGRLKVTMKGDKADVANKLRERLKRMWEEAIGLPNQPDGHKAIGGGLKSLQPMWRQVNELANLDGKDNDALVIETIQDALKANVHWYENNGLKIDDLFDVQGGVVECYLNIRKPFDVDGHIPESELEKTFGSEFADYTRRNYGYTYVANYEGSKFRVLNSIIYKSLCDWLYDDDPKGETSKQKANRHLHTVGYDGITHIGGHIMGGGHEHRVWIAFDPHQVKSVQNSGTFLAGDSRMQYSKPLDTEELSRIVEGAAQRVLYSRMMRRGIAQDVYRHLASVAGQGTLDWHEEEHPRASDGKFAPKGEGEIHHAGSHQGRLFDADSQGSLFGWLPQRRVGKRPRPLHEGELPQGRKGTRKRVRGLFGDADEGGPGHAGDPDLFGDRSGRSPESRAERAISDGGNGPGGRAADGDGTRPRRERKPEPEYGKGNWRYGDLKFLEGVGLKTKFRNNIAAIKTIRQIEAEGRAATPEEQQTIAKFTGWGQFPGLFKRYPGDDWRKEQDQLKEVLSESEYTAAQNSSGETEGYAAARKATLNSHFTSPQIVDAHWRIARKLGFNGGRFLEPSIGSGYYVGMMPPDLAKRTSVTGVELDKTTSQIAKHLYPSATVKNMGFEQFQAPDNFYDLVASNVPFGDYKINEERYNKFRAPIHDHFFLKSVDKTRPGGLVMHVTSTGTMDKKDDRIRAELAKNCDLISAIRLPGSTHKDAANTEVVTDLIILKKRGPHGEAPAETPEDVKVPTPGYTGVLTDSLGRVYHFVNGKRVPSNHWLETTTVPDPAGGEPIEVNRYFADHPDQILGTLDRTGTMYRSDSKNVTPPEDFDAALEAAISRIPEGVYRPQAAPADRFVEPAPEHVKDGAYVVKDGEIWQRSGGQIQKANVSDKDAARIKAADAIRKPLRELIAADMAGDDSDEHRHALGDAYDAFVAAHGPLHSRTNFRAMQEDPDMPLLMSLEKWDEKTGTASKADIFTKNTIRPQKRIDSADSVPEALGITLNETGSVDVGRIAALTGREVEDIEDELSDSGTAFNDPEHGWVPRAEYLSGNVRQKLAIAKAAAEGDPRYLPNVRALEANQPEDIDHTEISAKLGAPWIPADDMGAFAGHLTNARANSFHIEFVPQTGQWTCALTRDGRSVDKTQAAAAWSTHEMGFMQLLEAALNNKNPTIYKTVGSGDDAKRTVDPEATENARGKIQDMRDNFADWLWSDDERRQRLHRHYNDNYNNIVPMQYEGTHLDFPGMRPDWKMRDVQKNFVWQAITRGKGVIAHEVGVGKTATMVASAMELRRLGLAKKPAIACLKSNLEQLTQEAQELYPGAKILSTSGMFDAKKRKETISRIATGDYDMVFLSHDHLNLLPMSAEVQARFVRDEMEDLEAALESAQETDKSKDKRTVKQLEKRKAQLESSLKEILDKKKDDAVTFEQTGIDFLMVDEAHKYKSLPVYTSMGQVAGIPTNRSDRATNMLMRTRWLQEQNGGRGVIFATGTPISNTMAEMYNLQRYIQPEELKARGLERFDAWANTFGEMETALEPDLKGGYKTKTRFSKFVNIPELMQIARQDLDVRRADQLKNPDGSPAVKRPDRHEHMVLAPETSGISAMMADINERARAIQGKRPQDLVGGDNPLSLTTLGRQGSVDLRLYNASAPDDPNSKVNKMVRNVLDWYHDPEKVTIDSKTGVRTPQTQLIFSDIGVHPVGVEDSGTDDDDTDAGPKATGKASSGAFHLYQDIIDKLVAGGIPREEIADFGRLEGKKKLEAAAALKAGKMRIGIGSTDRLGTGNNVQTHLGAMHHIDIPYVPTSIEQRNGRGHRHGNKSKDIDIFHYVSEGSLDEMSWGIVSRKANFIRQAVTDPKAGAREVTEEDAQALTPQQLMAAASGDTRILERVNLADQVKNLRRSRARHERDQERLKKQISTGTERVAKLREQLKGVQADADAIEGKDFHLKLPDGQETVDRKPAEELLSAATARIDREQNAIPHWQRYDLEPAHVGDYKGMPLYRMNGNFTLHGPSGQSYAVSGDNLASVEATARGLAKRAGKMQAEADKIESDLKSIGGQVGKPFSRTDALKKAEADLAALEKELREKPRKGAAAASEDDGDSGNASGGGFAGDVKMEPDKHARAGLVDLFSREFRLRDFYGCDRGCDCGCEDGGDRIPGGKADGMTDADFDPQQVAMGQESEGEHTSDPDIAGEIARDHLAEDPEYYTHLARMELQASLQREFAARGF